jgi:hypothetical protein
MALNRTQMLLAGVAAVLLIAAIALAIVIAGRDGDSGDDAGISEIIPDLTEIVGGPATPSPTAAP